MIPQRNSPPPEANPTLASDTLPTPLLALSLGVCFALYLFTAAVSLGGKPFCGDERAYLYQARLFAENRLYEAVPERPERAVFDALLVWHDGKLFSKYAPGYSLVLSLGVRAGVPWLVNPVIAVIALLLTFLFLRTLVAPRPALVVVTALGLSPYMIGYAGSFFAQPLSFLLTAAAFWATRSWQLTRRDGWLLVFAAAIGALIMTRPLDAACAGTVLGIWLLRKHRADGQLTKALIWIAPTVKLIASFFFFNYWLSGRFGPSVYPAFELDFKVFEPLATGWSQGALVVMSDYLKTTAFVMPSLVVKFFLPHVLPLLPALAILGICKGRVAPEWIRLVLVYSLSLAALYNFHPYPYSGWPLYGARYYFPALIALAALSAAGIEPALAVLRSRLSRPFPTKLPQMAAALLLLAPLAAWPFFESHYRSRVERYAAIERAIASCPDPALVVLHPNLPPGFKPPRFVEWSDLHRNRLRADSRVLIRSDLGPQEAVISANAGLPKCVVEITPELLAESAR